MTAHRSWKLGLLGTSLAHSASPGLFAELFAQSEVVGEYDLLAFADWAACAAFLASDEAAPYDGFNVTVPFKTQAAKHCHHLRPAALSAGAVNVMLRTADGRFVGDNTDTLGFMNSIRPFLASHHERAMVLGRGGAAMAVAEGLKAIGIEVVHLVRTADPDAGNRRELQFDALRPEAVRAHRLVVQATPVGTAPDVDALPSFEWEGVGDRHLVVDLVYNPEQTAFLKRAEASGATTLNGMGMLQAQAGAGWRLFQAHRKEKDLTSGAPRAGGTKG